ncbi:MAG: hypothetical protein ACI4UM_00310 [Succinivibrio sp.]
MSSDISAVVDNCRLVALLAKDGCPAATYEKMTPLLEEIISLTPLMNVEFPPLLNSVIAQILQAQEIDDLLKIADLLEFEMVFIIKNNIKNQDHQPK